MVIVLPDILQTLSDTCPNWAVVGTLFLFHSFMRLCPPIVPSELLKKVLVQRHPASVLATPSTVQQTEPPSPRNVKNRALHGERAHPDGYAINASAVFQLCSKETHY